MSNVELLIYQVCDIYFFYQSIGNVKPRNNTPPTINLGHSSSPNLQETENGRKRQDMNELHTI